MAKKSAAQIKRNMKRAETRGEVYVAPEIAPVETTEIVETKLDDSEDTATKARRKAAEKLQKTLKQLEDNTELKAKDRRSEKRKAMAVATEQTGEPAEELLEWFSKLDSDTGKEKTKKLKKDTQQQPSAIPYIAFVGQLSFTSTKEALYNHIQKALASERLNVTPETLRIRLLTDAKTKKSRGMAFVEVDDPEILYALLKLHHTMLDDRRINVERSSGGGKEGKKGKIEQFRKDQQVFMESQVKQIVQEYIDRKELVEGELDETAILVCTRHSPVIVQAALNTYVEKNGRDMDNPSAYFTFLITKIADEGVPETATVDNRRENFRERSKRPREETRSRPNTDWLKQSELAKEGVDMSASEPGRADLSSIFPSAKRGRGRGQ